MITQREIYLDANATHQLLPAVRQGLAEALLTEDASLSNPASIHRRGQKAKASVAKFRDLMCEVLGRPDGDEFIFLSGATEALNTVLKGFVAEKIQAGRTPVLLASTVEHKAVLDTLEALKAEGVRSELVGVDRDGQLKQDELFAKLSDLLAQENVDVLLCLQLTNNETGVSFALPEIFTKVGESFGPKPLPKLPKLKGGRTQMTPQRIWICLDAAQAFCKIDDAFVRSALHFADYMAFSAHKIGGPPGIGALWVRASSPLRALITGGTQERKRRAGTLNSLGLLGFKIAMQDWVNHGAAYRARWVTLRDRLAAELRQIPGLVIHGETRQGSLPTLSNTLNFHVEGCPEESLLLSLDLDGFCLSSGSACNSGSLKPSHVLMAMGYSKDVGLSSIRVSLGTETTAEEVEEFIKSARAKVAQIRAARQESAAIFGTEETTEETSGETSEQAVKVATNSGDTLTQT